MNKAISEGAQLWRNLHFLPSPNLFFSVGEQIRSQPESTEVEYYNDILDTKHKARAFCIPHPEYGKAWAPNPRPVPLPSLTGLSESSHSFPVPFPTPTPPSLSRQIHMPHVTGREKKPPCGSTLILRHLRSSLPNTSVFAHTPLGKSWGDDLTLFLLLHHAIDPKVEEKKDWKIH